MSDSVVRGQRTRAAVQKKATSVRRAKKSKVTSAAVLVLSGSTALRRRKAAETLAETLMVDLFRDDRYANAETAHFLQRIESHNGIVILTTNGKQRIDQAFSPRTQVVVMVGTMGTGRMKKK